MKTPDPPRSYTLYEAVIRFYGPAEDPSLVKRKLVRELDKVIDLHSVVTCKEFGDAHD